MNMKNKPEIRVFIIDDHEMVRKGLIYFLESRSGFQVVGEADSIVNSLILIDEILPDIILMDLVMPEISGLDGIQMIKTKYPNIEILVISSFIDDEKVHTALRNGASGYMMKDSSPIELARAIKMAANGEVYLHPEAARRLASSLRNEDGKDPSPKILTEREIDVIKLVARGLSNQNIADDLTISLKTVKTHVSSVLNKLNLNSRVQIALYALRHNIVPIDDV
jgi:two-component system, NarL family, response regulator LiaR